MAIVLIGIDDTDNASSPGTGRLARELSAGCAARGMRPLGVTRHQFPLDERIPYTSHNSGACVGVETADGTAPVDFAAQFIAARSAEGSDPGVCVAEVSRVPAEVIRFAERATVELVEPDEALSRARSAGLPLLAVGGSGLGVIGALGSVGLRAGGNEGRFIDLPGLRELPERVAVADIARLGIRVDYRSDGRCGKADDECVTLGWVRPRLSGGEPVLPLQWDEQHNAWFCVDTRRAHPRR